MRRILVVDDIREFEGATHAKTAAEGLQLLQAQEWDELWLDHDLGGRGADGYCIAQEVGAENTIWPVIEWLEQNEKDLDRVHLITFNPVGMRAMVLALRGKYRLYKDPGGFNGGLKCLVKV